MSTVTKAPKSAKKSEKAADPKATSEAIQDVVDAATQPAETTPNPKQHAPRSPAAKKPDPRNDIRSRLPNSKEPEKPAKPAAATKKPQRPEPEEEVEVDDEADLDEVAGHIGDEDERDDDHEDRRTEPARRQETADEIDDRTFEDAEEAGYSRREARELSEELGGPAALKKFMLAAKRRLRDGSGRPNGEQPRGDARDERREERRTEQERTQPDDVDPSEWDKELETAFATLELSDEDYGEAGTKLGKLLSERGDGQGKAIVKALRKIAQRFDRLEHEHRRRAQAEMQSKLDDAIRKLPPELADTYGKVATSKLPASSPLREARSKLWQEMQTIVDSRTSRGLPPLDIDELQDRAITNLHEEVRETTVRKKIESERGSVRGTPLARPNGRSTDLPRGRDRALRGTVAAQRKAGWLG